ncbi:MAG: type II toxin-antitoxin system Phd/YefM family antitoxin [Planctomycetota bacterium]
MTSPRTVAVRRLRATLRAVVRAVEEGGEPVVVTRHGRPVAALVPVGVLGGDETSVGPATNRALEVSVPSPPATPDLHTLPSSPPEAQP